MRQVPRVLYVESLLVSVVRAISAIRSRMGGEA